MQMTAPKSESGTQATKMVSKDHAVSAFVKKIKSLFVQPVVSHEHKFIEIMPCGFISRNYLSYISGQKFASFMADKTLKVTKINGSIIIESTEGHLVELDKLNRVVMVRVHKHEAEIAKNRSGNSSYESLYSFSANENGSQCMHLPAGITVTQNQQAVVVKLPDGAIFENAFQQAV